MVRPTVAPPAPRLVDVDELAEYLHVSPYWVRRQVKERRIPFTKVGRHLRFDLDLIAEWREANTVYPESR
jgi:excisionase family DNA binding protein